MPLSKASVERGMRPSQAVYQVRGRERHVQTCKVVNISFPSLCLIRLLGDVGEEEGGGRGGRRRATNNKDDWGPTVMRTVREEEKKGVPRLVAVAPRRLEAIRGLRADAITNTQKEPLANLTFQKPQTLV